MSNRQFFKRRSFIFLLVGLLIGTIPSAIFVAAQSGTPTTFTISGGRSPGAPDWTIYLDGGYYWAKNEFGVLQNSTGSTSFSSTVNAAMTSLTAGRTWLETVYVTGAQCTVDNTILIPQYTRFAFDTTLKLGNAVNKAMIQPAAQATADSIVIDGLGSGILDGNSAQQSSVNAQGIDWTHTGTPFPKDLVIQDLSMRDIYAEGIYVSQVGTLQLKIYNVRVQTEDTPGTTYALSLHSVSDFHIADSWFGGNNHNTVFGEFIEGGHFTGLHIDGTMFFDGIAKCEFTNIFIDVNVHQHVVTLQRSTYTVWSNIQFRYQGNNGWVDKYGIYLFYPGYGTGSYHNQFSNVQALPNFVGGSDLPAYVIYESNALDDNNQYVNVDGTNCATGALYLKGAVSKGQHQNIIGAVTEA